MGDVKCLRCGEPYDTDHLKYDAIWDAVEYGLPEIYAREFAEDRKLHPIVRSTMKKAGWEFGSSVLIVKRCPSCKSNEEENGKVVLDEEKLALSETVIEVLGDDEDGIEAELEDLA